jgi:ribosomal protein L34E
MVQAHHPNYDYPLQVVWLCSRCHSRLHGVSRRRPN